ncbi:MAG: HepT-like ribonuclease domain-containing protein [Bacilli bacterium]|jgi:uncharacterized protein with HEPN domain|nr:DUF86 domain-containing protein [Bacilli bacterium]NLN80151.1 DUF86 domain-containing protein [Erysipelotrichia bacterium]
MKDEKYIKRVINYCHKIIRYLKSVDTIDDFITNEEKVDAVLLNLEQIGETAKKLSKLYKVFYPDIEWNKIIGLRNLISHDYEGVDTTLIYNVATNNIPKLLESLLNLKQ